MSLKDESNETAQRAERLGWAGGGRVGSPEVRRARLWSRRDCLRIGALGAMGSLALSTRDLFALANPARRRAERCILVYLNGGLSHIDSFDPKPEAPREIRGDFAAIDTSLDGLRISEHMPQLARRMHTTALVRSVTSPEGNHDRATHYMLTGWRPSAALVYPSLGSVAARESTAEIDLPPYVAIPAQINYGGGSGYLSAAFEPFAVHDDPKDKDFQVRDLVPAVSKGRFARRRQMLEELETLAGRVERDAARDANVARAFQLLASQDARAAFDLSKESTATRQRYGHYTVGQSCLLARRLIEADVPFVTVDDHGWDMHNDLVRRMAGMYPGKLPEMDMAVAALLDDLEDRGLLDTTLVVVMTDFGRTPKLNSIGGRDHWPRATSILFAGAGIRRGVVHGSTDRFGELPDSDPVTPGDVAATIYHCLGIDASREYHTPQGRPVRILAEGRPIDGILTA